MARLWLFVSAMVCSFGVVGCFDAPPTYSVPERLPPIIDAARSQPSTSDVIAVGIEKKFVDFDVFFRADDDADEPLRAYFVRDLPAGAPDPQFYITDFSVPVDTRTFEEQYADPARTLKYKWLFGNNNLTGRCHTVTLILSYVSNFNDVAYSLADPSLAAQLTWFVDLAGSATGDDTACWASGKPKAVMPQ